MMNNRTSNVDDIYLASLERESAQERSAYLEDACAGNPELRRRVERLLEAQANIDNFLEAPAPEICPTVDRPITESVGTQIGPYKLLEQIGEGGMGIVYVASQKEPLRRRVALKIIKPGMDTREVVARFEAERQALAMMDHPNIAKVFDAGATDAGRPYFAMELVKGTPITEHCDREQLSTRERLALFVTLCHGVQHAHQKGVIHRDLKPSNLLIEVHDVRPVPKIIDFGIAKAVGQHLTEKTFYTAQSQMVGTPLYMSPEQAGQSCQDVDTRSDIYSLGVLLYELLTGSTPFEKDALRTAGFDEMRRIIREVEPPRPSARVSTLQAADLSTISDRRHIEPGKLSQELRGELDWIVMKAMDKDRDRRYATVNDLAADVERYLYDEPVQACPPSVAYRFTKFARRNQAVLVTSALFALLLIVGTGISVWQAIRATNAEVAAITERDEKEQQAIRATRAEQAALADRDAKARAEQQTTQALLTAQERLQFGRQAVDDMYTQFAEKWLAQQAELTPVQQQFLEKALAFYQRLATEESTDPNVQIETARADERVGAIQRKLGQHKEAEAAIRQAVEIYQQVAREHPDEPLYRELLTWALKSLGGLLSFTGRLPEAEKELRLALEIFQTLVAQFPSEEKYQVFLALGHHHLGDFLGDAGRPREAEVEYRQAVALFESAPTSSPDKFRRSFNLAMAQDSLACIVAADKPGEAEALYRAAQKTFNTLVANDPENIDYRSNLAANHNNLGLLFQQLGRPLEAEASLRQALPIYKELAAKFPDDQYPRTQMANVLGNLADMLRQPGKGDEATQLDLQAREIVEKLAADFPDVPDYQSHVGDLQSKLAGRLIDEGKWEEARDLLQRAITHQQGALKSNPNHPEYRKGLAMALYQQSVVANHLGRLDEAETALRKLLDTEEHIITQTSSEQWRQENLVEISFIWRRCWKSENSSRRPRPYIVTRWRSPTSS